MWGEDAAEFAGFTTLTYTGAQGGRQNMNAFCAEEFGVAHLCHISEYYLSNSATPYPAGGAWLDASVAEVNGSGGYHQRQRQQPLARSRWWLEQQLQLLRLDVHGCGQQRDHRRREQRGASVQRGAAARVLQQSLHRELCRLYGVYDQRRDVRRPNAHFMCATEFPSSHLCHAGEYWRSHPDISPPPEGAWLDPSGAVTTQAGSHSDAPSSVLATPTAGRYGSPMASSWNCRAWTSIANGDSGVFARTGYGRCQRLRERAHARLLLLSYLKYEPRFKSLPHDKLGNACTQFPRWRLSRTIPAIVVAQSSPRLSARSPST